MSATVDAHLPLSLLEAMRSVDAPDGDDAEYVPELRNKRLGLSDTVYAQTRRYAEAARRGLRIPREEAIALARLIGRRADAEAVFQAAGRHLAQIAYRTLSPVSRKAMRALPSLVARPMAFRRARKLAGRFLDGGVRRVGSSLLLDIDDSVTLDTAPRAIGCSFYEASYRELLLLLLGTGGAVEHVRCASRQEGLCEWRAEWRRGDRAA